MAGRWNVLISLLIIVVQLIALGRAYQQTRHVQRLREFRWLRRGWIAMMATIVVMTGRRITTLLMTYHHPFPGDWLAMTDRYVIPGTVSLLLWIGIEGLAYGTRQLLRHSMADGKL